MRFLRTWIFSQPALMSIALSVVEVIAGLFFNA
jgi:hypothetical protein